MGPSLTLFLVIPILLIFSCKKLDSGEPPNGSWKLIFSISSQSKAAVSFTESQLIVDEKAVGVTAEPSAVELNDTLKSNQLERSDYDFIKNFCDGNIVSKGNYSLVATQIGRRFKAEAADADISILNQIEIPETRNVSDLKKRLFLGSPILQKITLFKRLRVSPLVSFSNDGKSLGVLLNCDIERYDER